MRVLEIVAFLYTIINIIASNRIIPLSANDLTQLLRRNSDPSATADLHHNVVKEKPNFRASPLIVLSFNEGPFKKQKYSEREVKKAYSKRKRLRLLKKKLDHLIQNTKKVLRNRTRGALKSLLRMHNVHQDDDSSSTSSSHEFNSKEKKMFSIWKHDYVCGNSTLIAKSTTEMDAPMKPRKLEKTNALMNEMIKAKRGWPIAWLKKKPETNYKGFIKPLARKAYKDLVFDFNELVV